MSEPVAKDQLKTVIERIQNLELEKKQITDDISEIYKEAKNNGFDVTVIRAIINELKQDENEREEFDAVFNTYWKAVTE